MIGYAYEDGLHNIDRALSCFSKRKVEESDKALDPVPQYMLTLGRSSVVQMSSRSEGAMRLHCDRNKRTQMHGDWPRRW